MHRSLYVHRNETNGECKMKIEYNQITIGQELPNLMIGPITPTDLVKYASASGDFNPIHHDTNYAVHHGLDGIIAHGMLIMAYMGRLCTNWADQRQIKNFTVKFKAMTKPGQTLTCKGTVKKKNDMDKTIIVHLETIDEKGEIKAVGELVIEGV